MSRRFDPRGKSNSFARRNREGKIVILMNIIFVCFILFFTQMCFTYISFLVFNVHEYRPYMFLEK